MIGHALQRRIGAVVEGTEHRSNWRELHGRAKRVAQADIVVSTAEQEFFGIAVVDRAGNRVTSTMRPSP